jgi:hypothetical protein
LLSDIQYKEREDGMITIEKGKSSETEKRRGKRLSDKWRWESKRLHKTEKKGGKNLFDTGKVGKQMVLRKRKREARVI